MANRVTAWPGSDEPHPCLHAKPGSLVTRLASPFWAVCWPSHQGRRGQARSASHIAMRAASCRGTAPGSPAGHVGDTPRAGQARPRGPSLPSVKDNRGSSTLSWGRTPELTASLRPAASGGKPLGLPGGGGAGRLPAGGVLTGHPSSPARLPVTLTPGVQGQGPDACAFCGAGGQG